MATDHSVSVRYPVILDGELVLHCGINTAVYSTLAEAIDTEYQAWYMYASPRGMWYTSCLRCQFDILETDDSTMADAPLPWCWFFMGPDAEREITRAQIPACTCIK